MIFDEYCNRTIILLFEAKKNYQKNNINDIFSIKFPK